MKTKILFDGNCIVCNMEITHYKKLAPNEFEIVDISTKDFNASEFKLNANEVNRNLHVITPDGQLKIGVEAFAHIWSHIPRYKFANKLINKSWVLPFAKIAYAGFTLVRPYLPKKSKALKKSKSKPK